MSKNSLIIVKENLFQASTLIRKAAGSLMLFELFHKLVTAFVVLPFSAWLLSEAASFSSIKFIGGENYLSWVFSPLVIFAIVIVLLILVLSTLFELSFLALLFNQYRNDKPLGFFRMLKIALINSSRVFNLKNISIMLYTLTITPLANSAIISALIEGFKIPSYLVDRFFSKHIFLSLFIFALLAIVLFLISYTPTFFAFTSHNLTGKESFAFSKQLMKGKQINFLKCFTINISICSLIAFAFRELVYMILYLVSTWFKNNERLYAIILASFSTVNKIISFLVPSFLVVCGFVIVQVYYNKAAIQSGILLPTPYLPKSPNKHRNNLYASFCLVIVIVLSILGASYLDALTGISEFNNNDTMIIAHRGASIDYPENTLQAFEYAQELLADYIELDVHLTKEGELIVIHDSNLKRTTGKAASVGKLTVEEIKKYDAGFYMKNYRGSGFTYPTLSEVFDDLGDSIRYDIEIKYDSDHKEIVERVANTIIKYDLIDRCVITSTHREALKLMKMLIPEMQCGYILSASIGNYYKEEYADFFCIEAAYLSRKSIQKIHKYGKGVAVWTVDSRKYLEKFIALGVDSIITNDPLFAREVLNEANNPISVFDFLLQI